MITRADFFAALFVILMLIVRVNVSREEKDVVGAAGGVILTLIAFGLSWILSHVPGLAL